MELKGIAGNFTDILKDQTLKGVGKHWNRHGVRSMAGQFCEEDELVVVTVYRQKLFGVGGVSQRASNPIKATFFHNKKPACAKSTCRSSSFILPQTSPSIAGILLQFVALSSTNLHFPASTSLHSVRSTLYRRICRNHLRTYL